MQKVFDGEGDKAYRQAEEFAKNCSSATMNEIKIATREFKKGVCTIASYQSVVVVTTTD